MKRLERTFSLSWPGWAALLFVLALIPRLPGLRLFLTTDEPFFTQEAASVVAAFLRGDFQGTYWHFYPGVTMSWLDGLGLGLGWMFARLAGATIQPFVAYIQGDILDFMLAVRLPYVLLTAASVAGFYLLARRLLGRGVALLGSLFLAFDPFYLAHSRVAHGDAPVTVFMGLSTLALFIYLQAPSRYDIHGSPGEGQGAADAGRRWLILSAIMGGLAALTKAPGQFLAPFVVVVGVGHWLTESRRTRRFNWWLARCWLTDLSLWGGVAALVFVVLWPAMWQDPAGTLIRMLNETFGKVEEGHLVFFMGQPMLKPGLGFYPYVTLFRLTPITLIGFLASLALVVVRWATPHSEEDEVVRLPSRYGVVSLLWLFVICLVLFGSLSPKKQDRYLLPLFPFLDLLAAFAFVEISRNVKQRISSKANTHYTLRNIHHVLHVVVPISLLIIHIFPVVTVYPYYLAYFNPLMGGLPRAIKTTLVGWGEGMEQVAAYLNQRSDADQLYVAAVPAQTFLPYFRGRGENFYTNDVALRADYVVLYVSQVQRLAPSPEIVGYFLAMEPEHTVYVLGMPYAWVYVGSKLITTRIPPEATLANIGFGDQLRLAGYQVSPPLGLATATGNSQVSNLEIALYWNALAPMNTDYTVSLRVVAPDGSWLAQHDSWPAGGLLPTSQWRQGDYVRDSHYLTLPLDAGPGEYAIEVVVYDAATGIVLNEPLTVTGFQIRENSS